GPWVNDREKQCGCDQQQCCRSSSKLAYVKQLSPLPLEVSLASIQQYCQKLWLNHGKIHRQPNSTVASSAQAIDAPEALLYPSHPIGLEERKLPHAPASRCRTCDRGRRSCPPANRVPGGGPRRGRSPWRPSSWRKARHPPIQLRCKVGRKLDPGRTTDPDRLVHQPIEERPDVLVVADDAEALARACRDAGGTRKQHDLLPDVDEHMIRQRNLDVRSLHLPHVTGEHGIGTSVEAAAADLGPWAGVADDPGL